MTGYVVVFEGDERSGYSAYSPDLPGVVAAGETREETEALIREALSEHIAILRQTGQPVPEPAAAAVTIVGIPPPEARAAGATLQRARPHRAALASDSGGAPAQGRRGQQ